MGGNDKIHNTEHWGAGVVTIPKLGRFYFTYACEMWYLSHPLYVVITSLWWLYKCYARLHLFTTSYSYSLTIQWTCLYYNGPLA